MTDPIADYLTRLRNAIKARGRVREISASSLKREITQGVFEKGYILNNKFEEGNKGQESKKLALKYNADTREPAITSLKRGSSPGLRQYSNVDTMPRVLNGLGIAVISTSRGVITGKEARTLNVGGEVLCYVY